VCLGNGCLITKQSTLDDEAIIHRHHHHLPSSQTTIIITIDVPAVQDKTPTAGICPSILNESSRAGSRRSSSALANKSRVSARAQVRAAVRLCAPQYGAAALAGTGMALAVLYCEDEELPPPDIVQRLAPAARPAACFFADTYKYTGPTGVRLGRLSSKRVR
jgi:phage terminase large subunit-like protein